MKNKTLAHRPVSTPKSSKRTSIAIAKSSRIPAAVASPVTKGNACERAIDVKAAGEGISRLPVKTKSSGPRQVERLDVLPVRRSPRLLGK